jgi:hypothetical protein
MRWAADEVGSHRSTAWRFGTPSETAVRIAFRKSAQRKAEVEDDLGDDLLGQVKALNRDLWSASEDARQANSLSAYLQVADRIQKQLALQSTLLERADGSEGNEGQVLSWQDCPHHPDGCPPDA